MVHMGSEDPFAELKKSHRDYKVFDAHYERIGKVDDLFVDDVDHPVYLSVSTGFLAGSVLVPMEMVRINDKRGLVEVDTSRHRIEEAPSLGAGDEITPDIEDKVRIYYGLKPLPRSHPYPDEGDVREPVTDDQFAFDDRIDLVPGEREAVQESVEGDPPYRKRTDQPHPEDREENREVVESSDGSRSPFDTRRPEQTGAGGEGDSGKPAGLRVRRFPR